MSKPMPSVQRAAWDVAPDSQAMNPTRRRFLFALGAGGAGAAAVASQVIPPAATEVAEAPDASLSPGYRETDHVRGYYRTAKI